MKKIILLFLTVFMCATVAFSQSPPFVNGTTASPSNSFPWNTTAGKGVQTFCPAGIFTGAFIGQIDTLWFNVTANQTSSWTNLEIKLQQNVSGLSTSVLTPGGVTVLSLPTFTGTSNALGWMAIPLATPFLFNPAQSLIVDVGVCTETGSGGMSTSNISISPNLGRTWSDYPSCIQTYSGQDNNMSWLGLSLSSPLSCSTPTNVNTTNIAQTSLTLGWTDNNTPAATTWQIEFGASGFTPTGNPQITTTNNPYNFTSLVQNTAYDFYVRAYCGVGDSSYYAAASATTLASCPFPSNLTASNVTSSGATLDWIENGSATTWNIEIGLSGFTPTGASSLGPITTKPYILSGLPQNTCFDYYVRSDCGPDSSVYIGPITFCTSIAPLPCTGSAGASIIFSEEFFSTSTSQVTTLPTGWTRTGAGDPTWSLESDATSSGAGASGGAQGSQGYAYMEVSSSSNPSYDTLKSPSIDLSGVAGAARIKFYRHMFGSATGKLSLIVDNGTTLTQLWTDSGQTQALQTSPWDSIVLSLNTFVGQTITLNFAGQAIGCCLGDMAIDQVSIEACISCPFPTAQTATNIAFTTADLGWTENGSATNWEVEILPTGSPQTGAGIQTSLNPYPATGLLASTGYDFYVRSACGANDSSSWAGPFYFATDTSCKQPNTLTAANVTAVTADLGWTETGTATNWEIEIVTTSTVPTGMGIATTTNPYMASGLSSNTGYEFYVRSVCGAGDSSAWTGPFSFGTMNAPLACPGTSNPSIVFTESFNATSQSDFLPTGWTRAATYTGNRRWFTAVNQPSSGANSGPSSGATATPGYCYFESSVQGSFNGDTLISPAIDLSGIVGAARVKFFRHMFVNTAIANNNMGRMTLLADNGTAQTVLWTDSGQIQTSNTAPWDSIVISLNAYVGQVINLRWAAEVGIPTTSFYSDMAIDEVSIEGCVACAAPTALVASNVTAATADLSWTPSGSETAWDVYTIATGGPAPGGATTPTVSGVTTGGTATPYTLSGLTLYQSIDIYVRADCGTDKSSWLGPITILPCAPLGGTYTIDAGSAASATNFQSFTAASFALQCGVSAPVVFDVVAASGPYNEQVIFPEVTGASATNTITINGNGETISFATTSTNYAVVKLAGSDWFRINDLTVENTSTATAFGIHLLNDVNPTNNNIIKRCTVLTNTTIANSTISPFTMSGSETSATAAGLVKADSNIIDSCTFIGGYYGVCMYARTAAPYATGNQLSNCVIQDFYNYGLYSFYQDDFLVSGNDISRPTRSSTTSCYALYHSGIASNQVWEKNYIHNMFDGIPTSTSLAYYIYMLQDAPNVGASNIIRNNIVDDSNGSGTHYLIYLNSANNMKVYHNTLLMNVVSGSGTQRGIMQSGSVGQDVQNNIIVNASTATGTKHGIYTSSNPLICDYNNVFTSSTTGTNSYGFNGSNQTTLANWQASTPTVGQNSSDIDPIFNQPAPNYLPANPLLNGTGNPVGVLDDYTGSPRSITNPDMGAFAFAVSSTDIALTQILSPDTAVGCYSANDTIKVELTNSGSTPHNFAANPTTITLNVTGATTATLTATVNTGTIPTFGTVSVTLTPTVNLTANGVYTMNGFASTTGDTILVNDTLSAPYVYNVNLSVGTIVASPDALCVSGTSTISLTGNMGGVNQFQSSPSATGPWTNVGSGGTSFTTGILSSTTYYRAYSVCNTNSDTSTVDTVVVSNPMLASTQGDTICGPNSATLIATPVSSTGSVAWYNVMTGGTAVATGDTFVTAIIAATDTFYAEANDGGLGGLSYYPPQGTSNGSNGTMFAIQNTGSSPLTIDSFSTTTTSSTAATVYTVSYANSSIHATPGSNTNPAFWTVLGTATGITNIGLTVIPVSVNITIPVGQTYSFQIASTGSINYTNGTTTGAILGSNSDLTMFEGFGGALNNMTNNPRIHNGEIFYSTGCPAATRTPVIAVVNPSSGDLALTTSSNASSTTGLDSLNDMQADGQTLSYYNPSCQLISTVADAPGGNALGMVTSKVNVDATIQVWNNQPYLRRWYEITPTSNGPANLTLYYTQADFDDYNMSPSVISNPLWDSLPTGPLDAAGIGRIRITKVSGGGLGVGTVDTNAIIPSTAWNAAVNRWEMTFSIDSFSQFYLHSANVGNAPLPVTITDFTVVKNGSVSDASWFTLSESNNSHFNVQRATDGRTFTTLGKVNTKATNGNSASKLAYAFTDLEPQIGHNYYRLEQVDMDGKMSYSNIIDLVWGADGSVVSIYPNPATDKLNIDVAIDKVTQMEVRLLDMSGRVVKSAVRRTAKGVNNITLSLSDVAAGVYGVQIYDNNTLIHNSKVNKK